MREPVEVEVARSLDELEASWRRLDEEKAPKTILGGGVSTTWEWHRALQEARIRDREAMVLVARVGDELRGVLPLVRAPRSRVPGGHRCWIHWQVDANTRPGLIVVPPRIEILRALLMGLRRIEDWASLDISVVGDSEEEAALLGACRDLGLGVSACGQRVTGYIPVDCLEFREDGTPSHVSKKFRYQLRTARRALREHGDYHVCHHSTPEEAAQFMDLVHQIERRSWKHGQGTAIEQRPDQRRLYPCLAKLLAPRAGFLGTVLRHRGEPVSFDYGIVYGTTYECLKTSYVSDHADFSPTHVMRLELLRELKRRDLALHDFIGEMDSGKKKWRSLEYAVVTYRIYGAGWRGKATRAADALRASDRAVAGRRNQAVSGGVLG